MVLPGVAAERGWLCGPHTAEQDAGVVARGTAPQEVSLAVRRVRPPSSLQPPPPQAENSLAGPPRVCRGVGQRRAGAPWSKKLLPLPLPPQLQPQLRTQHGRLLLLTRLLTRPPLHAPA